jgi:hypothetical protein
MSTRPQKTFVYGTFRWPVKGKGLLPPLPSRPGEPDIAMEILREFSAEEFVAKLYTRPLFGSWEPMKPDQLRFSHWYEWFGKIPQHFVFDMQDSGPWEVLHFRGESDETGPYVAVALRHMKNPATWIAAQRKQEGGNLQITETEGTMPFTRRRRLFQVPRLWYA